MKKLTYNKVVDTAPGDILAIIDGGHNEISNLETEVCMLKKQLALLSSMISDGLAGRAKKYEEYDFG